jgi:predicted transcriptional regulator
MITAPRAQPDAPSNRAPSRRARKRRWPEPVWAPPVRPFQPVPHILFMKQRDLGLDAVDLVVLLNISSYWWFRDRPPFLRTNLIAERLGVTGRTVQRVIEKLIGKGYITREKWTDEKENPIRQSFFDGLIRKLEELTRADPQLQQRMQKMLAKNESEQTGEMA